MIGEKLVVETRDNLKRSLICGMIFFNNYNKILVYFKKGEF